MAIKKLDSAVISQIAAGEVVERPASVVKELLENALDAGSSQITVEISGGGISLIRVADNGSGIDDDQTELAFERHATSKIGSLADLAKLSSLGFRGEALPSIAAVARVEMLTCGQGEMHGTCLELQDGRLLRHEKQARPQGTTISVHHLFRNLPARLKFLKSESAESGRIADIVSQYALAYPEVRFTLINESRTALRTAGSGKLIDVISALYGVEAARQMIEIDHRAAGTSPDSGGIHVSGLTGAPQLVRSTRDYLSFFVNRRWVNNRMLGFALEEAYHGLLMQGKHPVAAINITIPAGQIDVNVHPAKTEIKFQDDKAVFSALQRSVRAALVQSAPVHQVETRMQYNPAATALAPLREPSGFNRSGIPQSGGQVAGAPAVTPLISLPLLRLLGQLAGVYIVAEGPDGLYLIDQHAAHERIMLEKLRQQWSARQVERQGLLPAQTVEIEPRLAAVLQSHLPAISEFGFELENFGRNAFMVRAIPAVLSGRDWQAALRESLETDNNDWSEKLLNRLACHSAIRAGQLLGPDEMREMLRQLEKTDLPNSCPHGRPTMIRLTLAQIEKEFGRVS